MQTDMPIRVARFADGEEVREIVCSARAGGGVHVVQLSWGGVTRLAFGASPICQRLSLDGQALRRLSQHLGWHGEVLQSIERFFSHNDAMLSDLLDACSAAEAPYAYCIVGAHVGALSGALPGSLSGALPDPGSASPRGSPFSLVP